MFTTIRAVLQKQGQLIVKEQVSPVTVWLREPVKNVLAEFVR